MPLVTSQQVAAILGISLSTDLSPWIATADSLVLELCSMYTVARQTLIEQWLAAHFWSCTNQKAVSEGIGKSNISYGTKLGSYLLSTIYGQQAALLDTNGTLANMTKMMEEGRQKRRLGVINLGNDCAAPDYGAQSFDQVVEEERRYP